MNPSSRTGPLRGPSRIPQVPTALLDGGFGIWMDREQYRVLVDGIWLCLTPQERDLMDVLMRNPGRFRTRTELLPVIRRRRPLASERAVDSVVYRVRAKLGSAAIYLRSRFGHGYEWAAETATQRLESRHVA